MRNFLLFAGFLLVLCSCGRRLMAPPALDPKTNKLPTRATLKPFAILTEKQINLNGYTQFLVVKAQGELMDEGIAELSYYKYLMDALATVGGFDNYYDTRGLERYIIDKQLTDKVSDLSSNVGLTELSKHVGRFLVCEMEVKHEASSVFSLDYKISNPSNNEVIFHLKHNAVSEKGFEQTLFNPVLNRFGDWVKANKGY